MKKTVTNTKTCRIFFIFLCFWLNLLFFDADGGVCVWMFIFMYIFIEQENKKLKLKKRENFPFLRLFINKPHPLITHSWPIGQLQEQVLVIGRGPLGDAANHRAARYRADYPAKLFQA